MTIIKEVHFGGGHAYVSARTLTYAKSLEHINSLCNELKNDFGVRDSDINVVVYGGRNYKGTYGVESVVPMDHEALRGYVSKSELEDTLA